MRPIDADKLKAHYAWWGSEGASEEMQEYKRTFDTIIDLQPTVEAKPITRCKDCLGFILSACHCKYFDASRSGDDFCSSAMNKYGKENT